MYFTFNDSMCDLSHYVPLAKAADALAPRRVVRVRWAELGAPGEAPDTDDALRFGGADIVRRAFALAKPAPTREERAAAARFASKVRRVQAEGVAP